MFGVGYYYFDPTYILILVGLLLGLWASGSLNKTFGKYSKVASYRGMTGAEVAEQILRMEGLYDVRVERISGNLTDHYSPKEKVVRLSDVIYGSTSIAALGVAAHECGHAVQHKEGYVPLKFRSVLLPVANFGQKVSWPLILIGILFGAADFLVELGIIFFAVAVLFQVVTLPVEFNASKRALSILERNHILYGEEVTGTRKVLNAAALTYVAGAVVAIVELLRLIMIFNSRNND